MHTVRVRLRKPARVFTFLCKNIPLKRDERCVVRSDRGLEFGTCVLPPEEIIEDTQERYKMTVVRSATPHDEKTYDEIHEDEARAKKTCQKHIKERKLGMKLVDVEYTFDRRKIVFYFTAEERVDFRELVRDLAHELKARIELRHIQVRDEAKMIGGIGTCGRELCCTSWMSDFMPISMKMAKRQNLSLNPSKISGQCGRLMCCLSYENDMYSNAKRSAPPRRAKPDPVALATVRAKMESNTEQAEEVLKGARRRGATSESSRGSSNRSRRGRPKPSNATPTDQKATSQAEGAATESKTSDSPNKRRRRRRRKRDRGGKNTKSE